MAIALDLPCQRSKTAIALPVVAIALVICAFAVLWGPSRAVAEAIGEHRVRAASHGEAKSNTSETPDPEALKTGSTFSDCNHSCPEMVVMPAGEFVMGSTQYAREQPRHTVTFSKQFAVGRFAITFDEWMSCVNGGGCAGNKSPPDEGWGKGRHPVINVSWSDASDYVSWLSRKTGKEYRLLSEAEWEYVARAGSTTNYPWGNAIDCGKASYDGGPGSSCYSKTGWWHPRGTQRVGRYAPNAWGLYDMSGNVWQWCEDSWHTNYGGAPTDGSAWHGGDESMSILRGGAWNYGPSGLRSADRNWFPRSGRTAFIGFRVARPLDDYVAMLSD
jgi:formylglycine-generating enzyme required for sulfatase activity